MKRNNKVKFHKLISTNFRHQTKEFFSNSTLHGVRYIAEKGRPFGEKFMWFCCVAIGAVAAFVIIDSLWEKFQTNPTITGLDTDFHNQELEFPTVAVCPIDPFDEEKVNETAYRTLAEYEDNYGEYLPLLEMLPKLSFDSLETMYRIILNTSKKLDSERKMTLRQLAFKVAMKCEDLFYTCSYRGEEIPCCEVFTPLYSERGFCYAFNARYIGKAEEEIKNERINKLFETDTKWSISFVLNHPSKVYLHSTEEVSGYDVRPQFIWEEGYSVDLLITMKQTYTTDDAKQLSAGQRKCIFQGEVDLNYYKNDIYSLSACMKQCRMKLVNKLCKCIFPFYMPATGNYQQCTMTDFKCLHENRMNFTAIKRCSQCELSCMNTVYESEKFTKNMILSSNNQEDFRINIEFLTWPIIRYKREVLFGWVDLLVSFGGIAGLFLGFSLLSGVEIVYYFTMRAGCMFVKNRKTLYELQYEKESRPQVRYDLGIAPKFKSLGENGKGLRRRPSRSMTNIQIVEPVEYSAGIFAANKLGVQSFDGLVVPIKNPDNQAPMREEVINRLDVLSRFQKDVKHRSNIFRPIHVAPYATKIKPLDRKFKVRSHSEGPSDGIFYGYLP